MANVTLEIDGKSVQVPQGSTVMEIMSPLADQSEGDKTGGDKGAKPKTASGNTSSAAAAILQKYTRRQRG